MARFLVWTHISREQLTHLRGSGSGSCCGAACGAGASSASSETPSTLSGAPVSGGNTSSPDAGTSGAQSPWDLLRALAVAGHEDADPAQAAVLTDLCAGALRQGEVWGFGDEKLSALFGLLKATHAAATGGRMTADAAFEFFKRALLDHSVQRPPFSIAVFAQHEVRAVLRWFLQTYFRQYKLYQYAFTDRVTLDVATTRPCDLVEAPPPPPPLQEAATEEQHQQALEARRQQDLVEAATAASAAAAEAEAARARAVEDEYEVALPDDVRDRVHHAVVKELARLEGDMEAAFAHRHAGLLAKLDRLKAAAVDPAQ